MFHACIGVGLIIAVVPMGRDVDAPDHDVYHVTWIDDSGCNSITIAEDDVFADGEVFNRM